MGSSSLCRPRPANKPTCWLTTPRARASWSHQHAAELGERIRGRGVERPQHELAIDDRQRKNFRLERERTIHLLGEVDHLALSKQPRELGHSLSGIGMPARCTLATLYEQAFVRGDDLESQLDRSG
jgi:hypothetical protein